MGRRYHSFYQPLQAGMEVIFSSFLRYIQQQHNRHAASGGCAVTHVMFKNTQNEDVNSS